MLDHVPALSVLMPTYNVESYVEEAVRSILKQTYSDFELVIVDDCSTDSTYKILEDLSREDPRIRLYRNDSNQKIVRTLNFAWSLARGKYIARSDGDDVSELERLAVMIQYLEQHDDCDLVGSQVTSIDASGRELSRGRLPLTHKWINRTLPFASTVLHVWIARRTVYESLGGYRPFPGVEDYDFLLRARRHGFRFSDVSSHLEKVRLRNGNTVSTQGLHQIMMKRHVYAISVRSDGGIGLTSAAISDRAISHYSRGAEKLAMAVRSRKRPMRLVWYTLQAMLLSRYIARYVIEASLVRFAVLVEAVELKLANA